jgi:hypothetical protein
MLEIFNTSLIINIILHITILFTILANFFTLFICDISSDVINKEIKHIINDGFKHLNSDIINKINNIKNEYSALIQIFNDTQYDDQKQKLLSKLNSLQLEIKNLTFLSSLPSPNLSTPNLSTPNLPNLFTEILHNIPFINFNFNFDITQISQYFKNLSFDYYLDIFSKNNSIREYNNKQVFSKIYTVNILLILFVIIFCGTLIYTNSISFPELGYILLENIITFIFVGIIEIIFFYNIALKFIPTPPSLLLTTLLSKIKYNL